MNIPIPRYNIPHENSRERLRSAGMQVNTMEQTFYPLERLPPSGKHQITQLRDAAHTYESNMAPLSSPLWCHRIVVLSPHIPISHRTTMCWVTCCRVRCQTVGLRTGMEWLEQHRYTDTRLPFICYLCVCAVCAVKEIVRLHWQLVFQVACSVINRIVEEQTGWRNLNKQMSLCWNALLQIFKEICTQYEVLLGRQKRQEPCKSDNNKFVAKHCPIRTK